MASARLDALSQWSEGRSHPFDTVLAFGDSPATKGSLGKLNRKVKDDNKFSLINRGKSAFASRSKTKASSAQDVSTSDKSGASDQSPAVAGPSNTKSDDLTSKPAGDTLEDDDDAEALAEELLRDKDNGFAVDVDFMSFPEFDSSITIKIRQFWPHPTKPGKQQSRVAKIIIYRDSVSGPVTFSGFANKAGEWADRFEIPIKDMFKLHAAVKSWKERLWEITIPYQPEGMSMQNVYSANDDGSEDQIWNRLRRSLTEAGELKLLVIAQGVSHTVDAINSEFEELREFDPTDAWFPDARRKFIQRGMIVEKENRPQVKVGEHNTFPNFERYLLVAGYACIGEQECVDKKARPFLAPLRVLELPGSNGNAYFGFVTNLPEGRRLNSGDTMRVHPKDESGEIEDNVGWTAHVIDPLPFASLLDTSIILYRSHPGNIWDDLDMGEVTKVESLETFQDALSAVTNAPAAIGTFIVNTSDKVFKRQIAALRELTDNEDGKLNSEREVLLANHPSLLPSGDIYASVANNPNLQEICEIIAETLNGEQAEAVASLRSLPGSVGIVEGPPGTGKSHVITKAVLPLMFIAPDNKAPRQPVLILSASNKSVTQLATRLQDEADVFHQENTEPESAHLVVPPMVIRVHALSTEDAITLLDAESDRPNERPSRFEGDPPDLSEMMAAKVLMDTFQKETQRQYRGVMDKRVEEIELSLGFRMLQLSGFVTSPWAEEDNEKHAEFRRLFNSYANGEVFDADKKRTFTEHVTVLRNEALHRAHAIVTTPAIASEYKLRDPIEPRVIFVDEAARCSEFDLWGIFSWYPGATRVFVGDTRQLRPFSHPENEMYKQAGVSLMRRLGRAGYRTVQLTEQHRFHSDVCDLISPLFYENALTTAPSVAARPENAAFAAWAKSMFGISTNVLYVNTMESIAVRNSAGSSYNIANLHVGMGLVQSLLDHGFNPQDIGIICAYQAQWNLYGKALGQLQAERQSADIRAIRREKIDGFQGDEVCVEILDLTATSNPGFLREDSRVNTALTRARAGLVIISNHRGLSTKAGYQGTLLQRVFSLLTRARKVTSINNDAITSRFPSMDDIVTRAAPVA
ncbi:hypothetical protein SLS55_005048 [Diplodia seriata]|uniref:Uncharacterized protein n=1 Tax=Diplodia seriata TaxID=420778 RepID=A0ABR3CF96_9PEZI